MTASRSLSRGSEPLMLQTVEDALQRSRTALTERDRPFEEPLLALYHHTDYSVSMLRESFQNGRAGLDRETAEILADHLHATVGRVIETAKENRQRIRVTSRQFVARAVYGSRLAGCRLTPAA